MAAVAGRFVYDADCGVCTKVSTSLLEHAREGAFSIVSFQELGEAGCQAAGFTVAEAQEAAFFVEEGRPLRRGHHAIAAVMQRCGGWRRLIGLLLELPGIAQLASLGYRIFAANRHRLPGSTACTVPAAGEGRQAR